MRDNIYISCCRLLYQRLSFTWLNLRKRRTNFSKEALKVLNDFFFANINNPYPTEKKKEELAEQCNMTVLQVGMLKCSPSKGQKSHQSAGPWEECHDTLRYKLSFCIARICQRDSIFSAWQMRCSVVSVNMYNVP